jgi:pyruvate dehydrogenase E2 component (dihydrolipoamide acetyltransferase)
MAGARQFALPDVGEGLIEAEIVKWHVQAGDTVAVNDTLVEVETAKAVVDLPSPYAGVVAVLHAAEGETVGVGSVIVSFTDAEGQPVMPADEGQPQPVLVGYGPSRANVARRPRLPGYRAPADPMAHPDESNKPRATPLVRRRARELGINLAVVIPTGPNGRITRRDLEATAAAEPAAGANEAGEPAETRTLVKGVRRATAEAMVASAFTAPHVTEWVTVDVTESLELLDRLRGDKAFNGARLTPLVLIVRATLSALRAYPEINAKWDAAAGEIVRYRDVNLGIAAATPRGLLVPNIKAAQTMGTRELCDALGALIDDARTGRTSRDAMTGGTFTITNIGVFGVDGATPILNPGEAGILCVGQIVRRPWEHRGEVRLRSVCTLSLSFDHRLVDGQLGSDVLSHLARLLACPSLALVH